MTYVTRQYGSNPRWLMKALREVPHEIRNVLGDMDERDLQWRPAPGEWSAKDDASFLLESEREDLRSVDAIVRQDGARIEERRAYLAPGEHDYGDDRIEDLVWDFLDLRDTLLWKLEFIEDWEQAGLHPYRGAVTLLALMHEVNERDLEAAWKLRKLQEALVAASAPVRRRR
jgi:hypothetical protein